MITTQGQEPLATLDGVSVPAKSVSPNELQKRAEIMSKMLNKKFNSQELYFLCQEIGVYERNGWTLPSNLSHGMMVKAVIHKLYGAE